MYQLPLWAATSAALFLALSAWAAEPVNRRGCPTKLRLMAYAKSLKRWDAERLPGQGRDYETTELREDSGSVILYMHGIRDGKRFEEERVFTPTGDGSYLVETHTRSGDTIEYGKDRKVVAAAEVPGRSRRQVHVDVHEALKDMIDGVLNAFSLTPENIQSVEQRIPNLEKLDELERKLLPVYLAVAESPDVETHLRSALKEGYSLQEISARLRGQNGDYDTIATATQLRFAHITDAIKYLRAHRYKGKADGLVEEWIRKLQTPGATELVH